MKNALAAASAVMLVVVGLANAGAAPRSIPSMLPATTAADSAPFPHRLVADHAPGEAEMARLQAMLSEYRGLPDPAKFEVVERYLASETGSPWRLALRLNLGTLYYESGYYSRAIGAFEDAWHGAGDATNARTLPLRDAAVGELARMHARLGHVEELEKLLAEIGDRPLYGSASEAVAGAREGLWHMRNEHAVAYRCGPAALTSIVESARQGTGAMTPALSRVSDQTLKLLRGYPSGPSGVFMDEVAALADKTGLGLVPAQREGNAEIPLPAVVHWKVNHYAAIVGKQNGLYHVIDPTFGRDQWMSRAALDSESSGMFLIPAERASTTGWTQVAAVDTRRYYGRGYLTSVDQDDTREDAPTTCPNKGDGTGMCVAKVTTMLVGLRLDDKPVGYTPPVGPAVHTKVSYNQREASQPGSMSYFNIGPKWTLNWLSYIEDRPGFPGASVKRYASGGGELDYAGYNASTRAFRRELRGGAQLVLVSTAPVVYERRFANGGKEVYAASNGTASYPRRIFLSRIVDPQGNALSLEYDPSMRLTEVRDELGQATRFSYEEAANPLLVSRIIDPFGRTALFSYDGMGRLEAITDAVGIVSRFTYDGTGTFIKQLDTPYGTTRFAATTTGTSRSLVITDPFGHVSRTEMTATASGFPGSDNPPSGLGFRSPYQQYRNTFFWDGEAQDKAPGNYRMAQVSHWLHNGNIIPAVLESTKAPLETRIWFLREGQRDSIHLDGSLREDPSITARRLPDGVTQLFRTSYTANGNISGETDPAGRELRYDYDASGVDLLRVRRKVGSSYETIAEFEYNDQHRPIGYVDAAGQAWSMEYNARGQLTGATDPLGQATVWQYDSSGYLLKVINANGQVASKLAYDEVGRLASVTDAGGHTVRHSYDNLDRPLATTYPDGTATTNTWDKLDLVAVKDRLGRVTRYEYDANRMLVKVTDPAGNSSRFTYDKANRLVGFIDPNGNATQWERDIQGRVTAKQFPDGTSARFSYDTAGRFVRETDASGQVRQFAYARDNRLVGVGYDNEANPTAPVGFAWDPWFPRVTDMVDGIGSTHYSYYPTGSMGAGQLAREVSPQGSIAYVHDVLGRISGRSVNGDEQVFEYDALGRLAAEGNALGDFTSAYLGQTAQPAAIQLIGGKFDVAFGYEPNIADRKLADLTYTLGKWSWEFAYDTDAQGRVLREQGFVRGKTSRNPLSHEDRKFAYDGADRLRSVDGSNGAHREDYRLDPAANLVGQVIRDPSAKDRNNARNQWQWSAQVNENNQIEQVSQVGWQYDLAGNLLNDGKRSYAWDGQHRLVRITNLESGHITDIGYDGMGRRVRMSERTSASATPTVTRYLWCGEAICQKVDGAGNVVAKYFDQGEVKGDVSLVYQRDRLGSVRGVADPASGAELGSVSYTAYGQDNGSDGVLPDRRYAGMFFHEPSGLYLTLHRLYDPEAARWLSRDPIGERGGSNLYAYVEGNPVQRIDPLGLDWVEYTGRQLRLYGGSVGDRSTLRRQCRASSGQNVPGYFDYRNSAYQDQKGYGPTPEGLYSVNLVPNPNRVANVSSGGYLTPSPQGGIETIPAGGEQVWGTWRARLSPAPSTETYNRTNMYLHDSNKGETHGCIETCSGLLEDLLQLRSSGVKSIDVYVNYRGYVSTGR